MSRPTAIAPRLELLDVRAADRVRALLVELVRIEAADVVRLEDLRIEHAADAMGIAGPRRRLAASREPDPRNYNSEMERKLATVLFVDLVGSTELVSARDPEVVRRRVNAFFDHVSHCITTHGGIVEKFAGDAVMAAFGDPAGARGRRRARRARGRRDHGLGARARARGADRHRVGRGRRRRVGLDVRDRRGGQRRRAPAAGSPQPGEILLGPSRAG